MSRLYHINPKTMIVSTCYAKSPESCLFAATGPHFRHPEDARKFVEVLMVKTEGSTKTLSKSTEKEVVRIDLAPPPKEFSPDHLLRGVESIRRTVEQSKDRLPSEAYHSVLKTTKTLSSLLTHEKDHPTKNPEFEYEVEAISHKFLPKALNAYFKVPNPLIDEEQPNGKTPEEEIIEQTALLREETDSLYAVRHQETLDDFTTLGNFLRDKFGHLQNPS